MPTDWKGPYKRRLAKRASERGKRMAKARWVKFHAQRDRMDALDPVRLGRIKRRIVVIDDEVRIKERTFYKFDRPCDWKRKLREVLAFK